MKLITDQHEKVAGWASRKLGIKFVQPFTAIGFEDEKGLPRGAVIFNDYTGENIEISIVGLWTKKMFRIIGDYTFNQLKVNRVTARTRFDNHKVVSVMIRAGFRVEGKLRSYYPDGGDAVLFGMLRKECNWL